MEWLLAVLVSCSAMFFALWRTSERKAKGLEQQASMLETIASQAAEVAESLSESRFRRTSLRALSVVLGGSFGYVLGGYTGFAAIIGIGAGSLTTYVFSAVKSRVKQAAQESKDF